MSFENPSVEKKENKDESRPQVSESGRIKDSKELVNLFIDGRLKEGVTKEQALEVQREWQEKMKQFEERTKVYHDAQIESAKLMKDGVKRWGEENEFDKIAEEAKKIADEYYKDEYVPAYLRFTDLWTTPGRNEKTEAPKENASNADDLRKKLERFKS